MRAVMRLFFVSFFAFFSFSALAAVPSEQGELAAIAAPAAAPRTVGEAVSRLRGRGVSVIQVDAHTANFLIPAAGSLAGGQGTFFRSEITIANFRTSAQRIGVGWLAQNANNTNAPLQYFNLGAGTWSTEADFVATRLGKSGLGAILVFGVTSTGDIDINAELDGFSRIWTNQPGSATGTTSQTLAAVSQQDSFGRDSAFAGGLRTGSNFRSNVGVVNLDTVTHTWTISGAGGAFTLTVPPYSVNQAPVPAAITGSGGFLGLVFVADQQGFWWSGYASSVDNTTGDGWVSRAVQ